MSNSRKFVAPTQYAGDLSCVEAASAIQAARLNALDLLETAKFLYASQRFAHSMALSVLALEEAGKVQIIMSIVIGIGERADLWRSYRRHTSKTDLMNFSIEARAAVHFPELSQEELKSINSAGPNPRELDIAKQLALYSDVHQQQSGALVHLPRNADWHAQASERLAEAMALVSYLRDYPPDELEVWAAHAKKARDSGVGFQMVLKPLHDELLARGFITAHQWASIFEILEKKKANP